MPTSTSEKPTRSGPQPRALAGDAASRAPSALRARLAAQAASLGFDAFGIAGADALTKGAVDAGAALDQFVAEGWHGDMTWMAEHAARRRDPRALWADVRSILMVGTSYAPEGDPLAVLGQPSRGAISAYAKGRDYHDVLKGRLKQLASLLAAETGSDVKVFVDTAPLMEKPLAAAAGLGWQGKHTNLVSRNHGSWLFLGALLTSADLPADTAESDHCGSCARCLDICPTAAFPAPYKLDARRCIAYLTIEYKGHIPRDMRGAIGNRVFGCDDCLAVCPWNKFAATAQEQRFHARSETDDPPLAQLLAMSDADFRKRFAGTPVKRTGRDRFVRNCLIAAGNARDPALLPAVHALIVDPSPLVRAMAVWALSRIASADELAVLTTHLRGVEADADVLAECEHALAASQSAVDENQTQDRRTAHDG
ncbi:MAG: tRNA epoxyqueuosine(34) reductase QueG [Hyphomicrobiaceae bacterium]